MKTKILEQACALLENLHQQSPLVHCMTNAVVNEITANVLLAVGAAPAMIPDAEEAEIFAKVAGALLINVGTITHEQADAMLRAAKVANAAGTPWVLDPVAVGVLPLRTKTAQKLLEFKPTIIRGNASEILALAGGNATGRGVDSTLGVENAEVAAGTLAKKTGGAVLVTGETDFVVDANGNVARVKNGTLQLTRVTGVGCSQGALLAALVAVAGGNAFLAALTGALMTGIAGEIAAEKSAAIGSFACELLNAYDTLSPALLRERANFIF